MSLLACLVQMYHDAEEVKQQLTDELDSIKVRELHELQYLRPTLEHLLVRNKVDNEQIYAALEQARITQSIWEQDIKVAEGELIFAEEARMQAMKNLYDAIDALQVPPCKSSVSQVWAPIVLFQTISSTLREPILLRKWPCYLWLFKAAFPRFHAAAKSAAEIGDHKSADGAPRPREDQGGSGCPPQHQTDAKPSKARPPDTLHARR